MPVGHTSPALLGTAQVSRTGSRLPLRVGLPPPAQGGPSPRGCFPARPLSVAFAGHSPSTNASSPDTSTKKPSDYSGPRGAPTFERPPTTPSCSRVRWHLTQASASQQYHHKSQLLMSGAVALFLSHCLLDSDVLPSPLGILKSQDLDSLGRWAYTQLPGCPRCGWPRGPTWSREG